MASRLRAPIILDEKKDADGDDHEVGLESIGDVAKDNHTGCVNDNIDTLREVFDEKTCLDMLTSYYEILSKFNQ